MSDEDSRTEDSESLLGVAPGPLSRCLLPKGFNVCRIAAPGCPLFPWVAQGRLRGFAHRYCGLRPPAGPPGPTSPSRRLPSPTPGPSAGRALWGCSPHRGSALTGGSAALRGRSPLTGSIHPVAGPVPRRRPCPVAGPVPCSGAGPRPGATSCSRARPPWGSCAR